MSALLSRLHTELRMLFMVIERFQLMECDDLRRLQQWVAQWVDLTEFEIIPVTRGRDTAESLGPML